MYEQPNTQLTLTRLPPVNSPRPPIGQYTVPYTWTVYATLAEPPQFYVMWHYQGQPCTSEGPFPTRREALSRIWDLMLDELARSA